MSSNVLQGQKKKCVCLWTLNFFMALLVENYLNTLFLPSNVPIIFYVQGIISLTKTSYMSLFKCRNAFKMPSNIDFLIKKNELKKYVSDRPTLIFFSM